jgi:hypothetical protein
MPIVAVRPNPNIPNPFHLPGLSEELLQEIVAQAEGLRAQVTSLDPPTKGGFDVYSEKVRGLRFGLIPHGWTFSNKANFCTVTSPCGGHAIAVAQGTAGTGQLNTEPETVRPMGPATLAVVNTNSLQLGLFDSPRPVTVPRPFTWILLTHRTGELVFIELSLPDGASDSGFVCTWRQRYLLDPLNLSGPYMSTRGPRHDVPGDEDVPEIDVPVTLR